MRNSALLNINSKSIHFCPSKIYLLFNKDQSHTVTHKDPLA